MKKITVFISDDHAVVREGLRLLLQATSDMTIVGEADNGHQTVAEVQRLRPDVVLMNIGLSRLDGVEITRRISREVPSVKVLLLSSHSDDPYAQQAIEAGATGYLMKEAGAKDLIRAIREVCKGNAFFSPQIAKQLLRKWQNGNLESPSKGPKALTDRQTEVVQLVAEGHSNKQIATILGLSVKTIENHRQSLMKRLDLHDIASLTRYAIFNGSVNANPYDRSVGAAHLNAQTGAGRNETMRHPNTQPALRVLGDLPERHSARARELVK